MDDMYVLTGANVLRLEEKPFEIPGGIISFSPLFFSYFLPSLYPLLTYISYCPFSVIAGNEVTNDVGSSRERLKCV